MTKTPPEREPLPPQRRLSEIAAEIRTAWPHPYFGAVPYLRAMSTLEGLDEMYGADDATMIVLYFLSNATTWRGEVARRIKLELQLMLARHVGGAS